MPEAAVYEYGRVKTRQYYIRLARQGPFDGGGNGIRRHGDTRVQFSQAMYCRIES